MIGDQADFARRLRSLLPLGWFPAPPAAGEAETAPVLMGLLNGLGSALASIYALLAYANQQARIATATGSFLDAISVDFFGPAGLPRGVNETDATYRARIKASLFPARGTRGALVSAVSALTGVAPTVFEPLDANDTRGRGSASSPAAGGGYGYGTPGLGYGSLDCPAQSFVSVANPSAAVAVSTVYATIASVLPAGAIAWTHVSAPNHAIEGFKLDYNTLA